VHRLEGVGRAYGTIKCDNDMEFRIPKAAEAPLAEFIRLSSEQMERLVDAIRQSKPTLLVQHFANEVASRWGEDPRKVEEIITMLAGMYLARIDVGVTVEDFLRVFRRTCANATKNNLCRRMGQVSNKT
jgi:hypothetical protein